MKVLLINTVSGYGSTGSTCEDIANVLESQGHECYIAYGQLTTTYNKSFKIGTVIENHLHNLGSRVLGKQGYFTKNGTNNLIQYIKKVNPDVINLHNLHGNYLNLEILFDYLIAVQKPVVLSLHDCWAFTGKCSHYTDVQCYKWQSQCENCPQVQKYPPSLFFDQSKTMFADKKKWFRSLNKLTVIPVSNWLAGEVSNSFLNKYPIMTVHNWINHKIFKDNNDKDSFATQYNLDSNKFTILLVSAGWDKTDVKWHDALKLASVLTEEMQVIMIGNVEDTNLLPKNIMHIKYLNGKAELAKAYSFADVYVHLSTEDTFGKVIAEAMSCGTPAIVYDATACPEILGVRCGYVVEKRNIKQIIEAIATIKENRKSFYSENCRRHVVENFDFNANVNKLIAIFKEMTAL